MTLSLAELDKYEADLRVAAPPKAVAAEILPDLIEYARERAAREACEAAARELGLLELTLYTYDSVSDDNTDARYFIAYVHRYGPKGRRVKRYEGTGWSATEAYLALLEALRETR